MGSLTVLSQHIFLSLISLGNGAITCVLNASLQSVAYVMQLNDVL